MSLQTLGIVKVRDSEEKVLNGHKNVLTWVCYKHLSRGNSEATPL